MRRVYVKFSQGAKKAPRGPKDDPQTARREPRTTPRGGQGSRQTTPRRFRENKKPVGSGIHPAAFFNPKNAAGVIRRPRGSGGAAKSLGAASWGPLGALLAPLAPLAAALGPLWASGGVFAPFLRRNGPSLSRLCLGFLWFCLVLACFWLGFGLVFWAGLVRGAWGSLVLLGFGLVLAWFWLGVGRLWAVWRLSWPPLRVVLRSCGRLGLSWPPALGPLWGLLAPLAPPAPREPRTTPERRPRQPPDDPQTFSRK